MLLRDQRITFGVQRARKIPAIHLLAKYVCLANAGLNQYFRSLTLVFRNSKTDRSFSFSFQRRRQYWYWVKHINQDFVVLDFCIVFYVPWTGKSDRIKCRRCTMTVRSEALHMVNPSHWWCLEWHSFYILSFLLQQKKHPWTVACYTSQLHIFLNT